MYPSAIINEINRTLDVLRVTLRTSPVDVASCVLLSMLYEAMTVWYTVDMILGCPVFNIYAKNESVTMHYALF